MLFNTELAEGLLTVIGGVVIIVGGIIVALLKKESYKHNNTNVCSQHNIILTDLAEIKTDIKWIRRLFDEVVIDRREYESKNK